MKITFAILASSNDNYDDFKKVWIKNIEHLKSSAYKNCIDFYFIYSELNNLENLDNLIKLNNGDIIQIDSSGDFYNYYYKYDRQQSLMDSLLYRSISLMEYLKTNEILGDFFIRTNLTTFFDLYSLLKWSQSIPRTNLFAGTLLSKINSMYTHLSGTNLTLSRDVVEFVILNKAHILDESMINKEIEPVLIGDDARISSLVIENTNVHMLLIKRLDLIEISYEDTYFPPCIILQNAENLDNVFCYRFKTMNRDADVQSMNQLYDTIYSNNFNLKYYIENVLSQKYTSIYKQNQEQESLTSTTFKINRHLDIMNVYHHYKNILFEYPKTML
jgi:hypothetical protein